MDRTTQRAYAKLNLTLGVLYKRADGYHALDSIMQTIDLQIGRASCRERVSLNV